MVGFRFVVGRGRRDVGGRGVGGWGIWRWGMGNISTIGIYIRGLVRVSIPFWAGIARFLFVHTGIESVIEN